MVRLFLNAHGEQNHLDNICRAFLQPNALPDISSSLYMVNLAATWLG